MSRKHIERIARATSIIVLLAVAAFWVGQVGDVIEMLRLAYG